MTALGVSHGTGRCPREAAPLAVLGRSVIAGTKLPATADAAVLTATAAEVTVRTPAFAE